jgi:translation initiation factor 1 (eIF-1/SUI1)
MFGKGVSTSGALLETPKVICIQDANKYKSTIHRFIDLSQITYYALPFFPIVMAILETPTPLNAAGSSKVTPEAPKSLSPASIARYSEAASSRSQYCFIKNFLDSSRVSLPIVTISGVQRQPKRAVKLAKRIDKEIGCSGNLHTLKIV